MSLLGLALNKLCGFAKTITGQSIVTLRVPIRWTGYNVSRTWTYYTDSEVNGLKTEFIAQLDIARHRAGVPFIITRGLSTPEHNAEVGGVQDSAHLTGYAVDLACSDSRTRFLMINGLIASGITRIGVYQKHLHADADPSKDADVMWLSDQA